MQGLDELNESELRQHVAELRQKYATVSANLHTLKSISKQALVSFDSLKKKYADTQNQLTAEQKAHAATKQSLEQVEDEVKKLKHNTAEAFVEFGELQAKLELESDLRTHAEEFAAQAVTKNKKLKSAGKSLLALSPEVAKEVSEQAGTDLTAFTEELEEPEQVSLKLDDLAEQVKALSQELKVTRIQYTETAQELHDTKQKLLQQQSAGMTVEEETHIRKVSQIAYDEYSKLQKELEMERESRQCAESVAAQAYSENKAIRRKSEALMSSSANDKRVVRLQNDLEAISKDLEIEKIEHKKDVNKLNQQLHDLQHSSQQLAKINELEEKLLAAVTEAELMRNRADTLEKRTLAAESYCDKLKQENDRLQAAKGPTDIPAPPPASAIPPPPPPPPPGPPPPPLPTFRPISEIVQKNKKKKKTAAEAPKDPRVDAMAEMMARIKSGQVLLKHSDPQKKPGEADKSAMNQLATTLKLRKSLGGAARRPSEKAASSVTNELAMKLKRRQQRAGEDQTDNGTGEDIFVTPPASPVPRDRSLSYSPSPSPLRLNSEDPTTQDQKDRPYSFSPGTFPIRFTTDNPTSQGSRDDETLYEEINVTAVKQTASEVDNVYYETTVDLVEKGRSTDGSDVKTEAIEEQIYSVPDDPEQSDVAHDPTCGD